MKIKSSLEKYPNELESLDYICGLDEVGRGCLSGPVFVGAVILPKDFESDLIKDSKKLSEKKRLEAFDLIKEKALSWTYCSMSQDIIDRDNIQQATYSAMYYAIKNLNIEPQHLLVDGNVFENKTDIPYTCVVKGDNKWKNNKGYGSKEHIEKILSEGITMHHRKSFLNKILKKNT